MTTTRTTARQLANALKWANVAGGYAPGSEGEYLLERASGGGWMLQRRSEDGKDIVRFPGTPNHLSASEAWHALRFIEDAFGGVS